MDEFLKLYLTGKRAENMVRFRRMTAGFGIVGAVLTLLPVFFTILAENVPLTVVFSVLGVLFGAVNVGLKFYETAYLRVLVELQRAADGLELRGEEGTRSEKLYAAWTETLGRRSALWKIATLLSGSSYLLLAASAIVSAACSAPPYVLLFACLAFGVLACVASGMQTVAEGRARTAFYERAEREIEEIKREKFGMSEKRIASETENARAYSAVPLSVLMFLKEEPEKADFRAAAKKSGIAGTLLGLFFFAAIVFCISFGGALESLGDTVSWLLGGSVFAVGLGVFLAVALPLEGKKREIFRRNFAKLGEGEADGLRKELQTAWLRLQKGGNAMFCGVLIASVGLGILVGIVGYCTTEGAVLADCIGSCVVCFLIPAAILSVVAWFVIFAVYRRKVRPAEGRLREIQRGEMDP